MKGLIGLISITFLFFFTQYKSDATTEIIFFTIVAGCINIYFLADMIIKLVRYAQNVAKNFQDTIKSILSKSSGSKKFDSLGNSKE